MSAARGEVPDHGLVHDDRGMQMGFDLPLRSLGFLILAHTISASPRNTAAVSTTVRTIPGYAAHRQICPDNADLTSSSDGLRFLSKRAFAVTDQPAVQKPQSAAMYK